MEGNNYHKFAPLNVKKIKITIKKYIKSLTKLGVFKLSKIILNKKIILKKKSRSLNKR